MTSKKEIISSEFLDISRQFFEKKIEENDSEAGIVLQAMIQSGVKVSATAIATVIESLPAEVRSAAKQEITEEAMRNFLVCVDLLDESYNLTNFKIN